MWLLAATHTAEPCSFDRMCWKYECRASHTILSPFYHRDFYFLLCTRSQKNRRFSPKRRPAQRKISKALAQHCSRSFLLAHTKTGRWDGSFLQSFARLASTATRVLKVKSKWLVCRVGPVPAWVIKKARSTERKKRKFRKFPFTRSEEPEFEDEVGTTHLYTNPSSIP